jgi:hypothetical protein
MLGKEGAKEITRTGDCEIVVVVVARQWCWCLCQAESEMTLGMSMLPIFRKIRG